MHSGYRPESSPPHITLGTVLLYLLESLGLHAGSAREMKLDIARQSLISPETLRHGQHFFQDIQALLGEDIQTVPESLDAAVAYTVEPM